EDPRRLAGARELELVHQERRCHAEANDVHQTVELGAEARAGVGEARDPTVERVEDSREHDIPAGPIELPARRQHHRPDTEEQIEQREQTRHHHHDAPHVGRAGQEARPHGPTSARTVAPAYTIWPTFTLTRGRLAAGTNTS